MGVYFLDAEVQFNDEELRSYVFNSDTSDRWSAVSSVFDVERLSPGCWRCVQRARYRWRLFRRSELVQC